MGKKHKYITQYIILTLSVILVLVLAGCKANETKPSTAPFLGGTTGLLINFLENSPPPEVYDGGDFLFDVVVKLENDGEYTVPQKDVRVEISGVRPEEYGLTQKDMVKAPDADLLATQKDANGNVIEGPPAFVTFKNFNHKNPISGASQDAVFRASVCYMYQTTANAKVCVRENILNPEEGGVCEINGEKKVYNAGAPLQITSFKEDARAKDKIGFTFKIEQKGNGDVYQKGTQCEQTFANEDKIFVEINTGMSGLECSGLSEGTKTSGYVRLLSTGAIITCTQQISQPSDYESTVEIKVTYDYKENKETHVLVKHAIG